MSQIEDAITTGGYQVFVVQANDGLAVVPAIERAIKKGITVVGEFTPVGSNYASITPPVPGMIFVGEAPVTNGQRLGQLGIQACAGLNPCQLAYLQGDTTLPLDVARTKAVLDTLKTASNVKVVADPQGGYTQATGLKAAQDVLSAHPDVNVLIGSSQADRGSPARGQEGGQARQDQADRQRRIVPGDRRREERNVVRDLHHRREVLGCESDAAGYRQG